MAAAGLLLCKGPDGDGAAGAAHQGRPSAYGPRDREISEFLGASGSRAELRSGRRIADVLREGCGIHQADREGAEPVCRRTVLHLRHTGWILWDRPRGRSANVRILRCAVLVAWGVAIVGRTRLSGRLGGGPEAVGGVLQVRFRQADASRPRLAALLAAHLTHDCGLPPDRQRLAGVARAPSTDRLPQPVAEGARRTPGRAVRERPARTRARHPARNRRASWSWGLLREAGAEGAPKHPEAA